MFADIVDHQELLTGHAVRQDWFSLPLRCPKNWVGLWVQPWVDGFWRCFHYMPNVVQQSQETIFGEHIMISLMPAFCCMLAFVGMFFYPLSDKKVRENSEQLNPEKEYGIKIRNKHSKEHFILNKRAVGEISGGSFFRGCDILLGDSHKREFNGISLFRNFKFYVWKTRIPKFRNWQISEAKSASVRFLVNLLLFRNPEILNCPNKYSISIQEVLLANSHIIPQYIFRWSILWFSSCFYHCLASSR